MLDLETGVRDRGEGVAVAVAAVAERVPGPVKPILPPRELRVFGTDVLKEEKASVGLENAPDLPQHGRRIGCSAEDER